jgi:DNA mismatch endonuclease (patch repair protein)
MGGPTLPTRTGGRRPGAAGLPRKVMARVRRTRSRARHACDDCVVPPARRSSVTTGTASRERLIVDPRTSARLGRIRQHGTSPELRVRSLLHSLGRRFRVHNRDLPGSPDVANRSRAWVIFVHGCFWHRHAQCEKATTPSRNRDFWLAKFETNTVRDARVQEEVRQLGYLVVVVWECQTEDLTSLRVLRHTLGKLP